MLSIRGVPLTSISFGLAARYVLCPWPLASSFGLDGFPVSSILPTLTQGSSSCLLPPGPPMELAVMPRPDRASAAAVCALRSAPAGVPLAPTRPLLPLARTPCPRLEVFGAGQGAGEAGRGHGHSGGHLSGLAWRRPSCRAWSAPPALRCSSSTRWPTRATTYLRRCRWLIDFVEARGLPFTSPEDHELALLSFFDHGFLDGRTVPDSAKMWAALTHLMPQYGRFGNSRLPRVNRALQGWLRMAPPGVRLPLPEEGVSAVAVLMARAGFFELALLTMLAMDAYLRPVEAVGLKVRSLVPSAPHLGYPCSITAPLLAPWVDGVPTKTRQFDESVLLDSPRRRWMNGLLETAREAREGQAPGRAPLQPDDGGLGQDVPPRSPASRACHPPPMPVHAPSHRVQLGRAEPAQDPARHQEPRTLATGQDGEEVREACAIPLPDEWVRQGVPGVRHALPRSPWRVARSTAPRSCRPSRLRKLQREAPLPMLIRVRLFIEVFSGSGRLAAAAASAGFHVLCWDINMGPQYV